MRRSVVFAALCALLAAPSQAQTAAPRPAESGWSEMASGATPAKAGITLPLTAGTLKKTELRQHDQDGADLAVRYMSPGQVIQGTTYLSEPTFADAGLAFLATDAAIRQQWGPPTHAVTDQLRPVAGVKDAERRVTYEGAKSGQTPLVTMASFVRAGSWLVVTQVTGPIEQTQEINRDLDALVAGMTFAKGYEPLPVNVIKTEPCQPRDRSIDAKVTRPQMSDGIKFLSNSGIMRGKVPDRLCLESFEIVGPVALQIYRPLNPSDRPFVTRFYALLGNNGVILEVAESRQEPGAFYALRHGVGRATLFGRFDREPSIGQIRALAVDPDKQPAAILQFSTSALSPEMSGVASGRGVGVKLYCDWALNGCVDDKPSPTTPKP